MKITKYPQSCLLVEVRKTKLLFDLGTINFDESFLNDFKNIDAIFITHKHSDHFNIDALKKLKVPIYSNSEVAGLAPELEIKLINAGDEWQLGDFGIEVVEARHGYHPKMKGGKAPQENIGFLIDDAKSILYITSDTIAFDNDYCCDIIAGPATGHAVTMDSYTLGHYAKQLGAKNIIVTHLDNPEYFISHDQICEQLDKCGIKYYIPKTKDVLEF